MSLINETKRLKIGMELVALEEQAKDALNRVCDINARLEKLKAETGVTLSVDEIAEIDTIINQSKSALTDISSIKPKTK